MTPYGQKTQTTLKYREMQAIEHAGRLDSRPNRVAGCLEVESPGAECDYRRGPRAITVSVTTTKTLRSLAIVVAKQTRMAKILERC